jgi:serine/threonine-protein kinase
MLTVGKKLGPFDIEKELGSGAMGSVYRARNRETGECVAIKVIAPGLGANETALARFEREMDVLKQLKHPNIVRLRATGSYKKTPFYVMEYVEGESLDRLLRHRGRLAWQEVVRIGEQLCAALRCAHDQGIIHRDLKPSNLMMTQDGTLKLTDFGIAKDLDVTQLTGANCTVGTASYMSPEQCRGERHLSHKSDLYSMGVLLFELLTGEKPFKCQTTMDMFMAHVNEKPPRPSQIVPEIPVWLDTLVHQMMEKKPEHRPFDALLVSQVLKEIPDKVASQRSVGAEPRGRGVQTPADDTIKQISPTAWGTRRRKRQRRRFYEKTTFQASAMAVVLAGIVGVVVWAFWPAGADRLYERVEKMVTSGDSVERDKARIGPIRDYLRRFGDRDDEHTQKVRAWADQLELADKDQKLQGFLESQKGIRMFKIEPETKEEKLALEAALAQENGDQAEARERWQRLEQLRDAADPERRGWGLLAARKIQEVDLDAGNLKDRFIRLSEMLAQVREGKPPAAMNDAELQALRALRYEHFGDPYNARRRWQEVHQKFDKNPGVRTVVWLAKQRLREIKVEPMTEEQENKARQGLLQARLKEAAALEPAEALALYRDIMALYSKDETVQDEVAAARKLMEKLQPEAKPKAERP